MQHLTVSSNDPAPLNNNNKRRDATRYLYKCKSMCVCVRAFECQNNATLTNCLAFWQAFENCRRLEINFRALCHPR